MPDFNPENPFGENSTCDNDTQSGSVSLLSELALVDTPPPGEELVQELKEAMILLYMVDPEISKRLPIHVKVKSFLERFDVQVPITNESGSLVAKQLICRVWDEAEFVNDRNDAFELFDSFRNGGRDLQNPRSPSISAQESTINGGGPSRPSSSTTIK